MKNILIAGGTGFVGQNVARHFVDCGVSVSVTTRNMGDPVARGLCEYSDLITVERVDLSVEAEVKALFERNQFDGIIMLAQTHLHGVTRKAINSMLHIAMNCLECAQKSGVKRAILGGSIAVYGGEDVPFNEEKAFSVNIETNDLMPAPNFEIYVKRTLEQMFLEYGRPLGVATSGAMATDEQELEVAILRCPGQVGPGYKAAGNPFALAVHAAAGKISDFSNTMGYLGIPAKDLWALMSGQPIIYVKDTASALKALMDADVLPRKIYNACSDISVNPRLEYETLQKLVPGCDERLNLDPMSLPDNQGTIDYGFNSSKLKEDFGWEPAYDIEGAAKDYLNWLESHDI